MMFARSTTLLAQPSSLDSGIMHIRDRTMPSLLELDGCVGLSLLVDRDSGRCIATSAWDSALAMRDSEARVGQVRGDASLRFGGPVDRIEKWEIAALHREHRVGAGASVRCTWLQGPTNSMESLDQAIHAFKYSLLPRFEEMEGFTSASLFMNRPSGRAVTATAWDSRAAMDASREPMNELRTAVIEKSGSTLMDVAEFELALAHLRVPEMV